MGKRKNRNSHNGEAKSVDKTGSPLQKKIKHKKVCNVENENGHTKNSPSIPIKVSKNKKEKNNSNKIKKEKNKSSLNSEYSSEKFVAKIQQSWTLLDSCMGKLC